MYMDMGDNPKTHIKVKEQLVVRKDMYVHGHGRQSKDTH